MALDPDVAAEFRELREILRDSADIQAENARQVAKLTEVLHTSAAAGPTLTSAAVDAIANRVKEENGKAILAITKALADFQASAESIQNGQVRFLVLAVIAAALSTGALDALVHLLGL